MPYRLRLRRYDRVAEGMLSVHPAGNPMNHSSHRGLNCPPMMPGSVLHFEPGLLGFVPYVAPLVVSVGRSLTVSCSVMRIPAARDLCEWFAFVVAVGKSFTLF